MPKGSWGCDIGKYITQWASLFSLHESMVCTISMTSRYSCVPEYMLSMRVDGALHSPAMVEDTSSNSSCLLWGRSIRNMPCHPFQTDAPALM